MIASNRSARHEAVTLAAYREALTDLRACRADRPMLLARLGDIDRQASDPKPDARLLLAGRLIAAAQVSDRVRVPEAGVQALVRSWLAHREAERDDAAPAITGRVALEDEQLSGLTRSLAGSGAAFGRVAWEIAGVVLRHLIRPRMDVDRALALRAALDQLGRAATEAGPGEHTAFQSVLVATALRTRAAGDRLQDPATGWRERQDAWLRIGAGAVRSHARWAGERIERSAALAVGRATERLASSLVPEDPRRFPEYAALEHAVQAAFDAAVTALGLAVQPADPVFVRGGPRVVEALLEGASSALIGAWVAERLA